MKVIYNLAAAFVLLVITIVTGCANIESRSADVSIEKVSSSIAHFDRAFVTSTQTSVEIYGVLHKRHHSRTIIPGHVDIEIISPEGEVLSKLETDYHRGSIKARQSTFHVSVPMVLPEGSTVRLIHHTEPEKYNDNNSENTWKIHRIIA